MKSGTLIIDYIGELHIILEANIETNEIKGYNIAREHYWEESYYPIINSIKEKDGIKVVYDG